MATSETELVASAVLGDVLCVGFAELVDGSVDGLDATFLAHGLSGEVSMRTSPVPIATDGLGLESDSDAEILAEAVKEPASSQQAVPELKWANRPNLELPLRGHHFSVDACKDAGDMFG